MCFLLEHLRSQTRSCRASLQRVGPLHADVPAGARCPQVRIHEFQTPPQRTLPLGHAKTATPRVPLRPPALRLSPCNPGPRFLPPGCGWGAPDDSHRWRRMRGPGREDGPEPGYAAPPVKRAHPTRGPWTQNPGCEKPKNHVQLKDNPTNSEILKFHNLMIHDLIPPESFFFFFLQF